VNNYTWQQIFQHAIPTNQGGDRCCYKESSICRSCSCKDYQFHLNASIHIRYIFSFLSQEKGAFLTLRSHTTPHSRFSCANTPTTLAISIFQSTTCSNPLHFLPSTTTIVSLCRSPLSFHLLILKPEGLMSKSIPRGRVNKCSVNLRQIMRN